MLQLTRWSPFGSAFHLHRELDEMLSRFLGQDGATYRPETGSVAWSPAIESYGKDGELHVRVALPGVDPKDVEVTVSDDELTIRGERKTEHNDAGRYVREFTYGSFERTFTLPEGIDATKVKAKFANGMLDLTLPAPVAVAPKKVEIQIEGGASQANAVKAA
jgi:HSP20 family protein